MMVLSAMRPDASLLEFLATRARSATALRLAVEVLLGAGILAAALWWDSSVRLVGASAASCLLAYGAWGLIERASAKLGGRSWRRTATVLDGLAALIACAGVLAAIGVLFSVWALALGSWIS